MLTKHRISYLNPQLADIPLAQTGFGKSYAEREWRDLRYFSVPMLLHYEDRMSMSCGREMRVPFLDYRLIELLAKIPPSMKLNKGWTKAIFRKTMNDFLPKAIAWRKDKKGFTIPEESWMRNVFYHKIRDVFFSELLAVELNVLDQKGIKILLDNFITKNANVSYKEVFNVYCLEIWLRRFQSFISSR